MLKDHKNFRFNQFRENLRTDGRTDRLVEDRRRDGMIDPIS